MKRARCRVYLLIVLLVLACDFGSVLGTSPTPIVIVVTATPVLPTWTPYIVYVTATPARVGAVVPSLPATRPAATAVPGTATPTRAVTPTGPKVLRLGHGVYPDVLDPQRAIYANEIEVLRLCYEGLTTIDAHGNVNPGAADSYNLSADGLTLTFHIRDGLVRVDGTPLNASDYEYALRREVDPRLTGKDYANIMLDVKGAGALIDAEGKSLSAMELANLYAALGVKADDSARTLTVSFAKPTGFWQAVASTVVTFPPDKRQVDADPAAWWKKASGHNCNGPFKIQSIESPTRIVYAANANYWRGKPKLDRVEAIYITDAAARVDGFRKGQFDIVNALPGAADPDLRYPAAQAGALLFNHARKPFDDRNVRAAFSQALDRDTFIRQMNQGLGTPYTRWIPPGVPGALPDKPGVPATDPAAAVQTLLKNGYATRDGKVDCAKLGEIKLTYPASPSADARYKFLADNFTRVLGCPVALDPVNPNQMAVLNRNPQTVPQLQLGGWVADYPHPQNWLSVWFHCTGQLQRFSYCNADLDAMLYKADAIYSLADALNVYQQAEEIILQDVALAPISYSENLYLIKPYLIGPRDHLSSSDANWAGEWGPVFQYDVDLTRVPESYPKQ